MTNNTEQNDHETYVLLARHGTKVVAPDGVQPVLIGPFSSRDEAAEYYAKSDLPKSKNGGTNYTIATVWAPK